MSTNNLASTLTSREIVVPLPQTTLVMSLTLKFLVRTTVSTRLYSLKSALKDKIIFRRAGK